MTIGSITALTLSAVQYEALDGGVAANVPEHIRLIEDAESHGARLVIFPELSLTGYRLDLLEGPGEWLSAADRRLDGIREICRRTGITAVVGAAFRRRTARRGWPPSPVHPAGTIEASFKTHLHGPEQDLFVAGSHPAVLEIDGWKIALAICFDAARPGHAEWAADAGADIYAVSALYTAGEDHRLALHLGARAMDNRMFSVLANLAGATPLGASCGLSGFWGPTGFRSGRRPAPAPRC